MVADNRNKNNLSNKRIPTPIRLFYFLQNPFLPTEVGALCLFICPFQCPSVPYLTAREKVAKKEEQKRERHSKFCGRRRCGLRFPDQSWVPKSSGLGKKRRQSRSRYLLSHVLFGWCCEDERCCIFLLIEPVAFLGVAIAASDFPGHYPSICGGVGSSSARWINELCVRLSSVWILIATLTREVLCLCWELM